MTEPTLAAVLAAACLLLALLAFTSLTCLVGVAQALYSARHLLSSTRRLRP